MGQYLDESVVSTPLCFPDVNPLTPCKYTRRIIQSQSPSGDSYVIESLLCNSVYFHGRGHNNTLSSRRLPLQLVRIHDASNLNGGTHWQSGAAVGTLEPEYQIRPVTCFLHDPWAKNGFYAFCLGKKFSLNVLWTSNYVKVTWQCS